MARVMETNDSAPRRNTGSMDPRIVASSKRLPFALVVFVAAVAQLGLIRLASGAISPLILCGLGVLSVVILNGAVSLRAEPPPQQPAPPR